jgi:hypothetical protein
MTNAKNIKSAFIFFKRRYKKNNNSVRSEVSTAATMKNAVF